MEAHTHQGSPVPTIHLAMYMSWLIQKIKERVSAIEGLFIVHDIGLVAMGWDVHQIMRKLESSARLGIDCAKRWELEFDTITTDVALFTHRPGHKKHLRPEQTAKI